ncbi:MAG: hypothetical protein HY069_00560 [Chlamydiia bacterium]|nr:hypothetical protein [Chlamydiia bacterium]
MSKAFPIESLGSPDWQTYQVWFHRKDASAEEKRYEIVHIPTLTCYLHEPLKITAEKCGALVIGGPAYCLAYAAWHLVRAPLVATACLVRAIGQLLQQQSALSVLKVFQAVLWEAPLALLKNLLAAIQAPFYGIALACAALYGIRYPLAGRRVIGKIEQSLHRKTRFADCLDIRNEEASFGQKVVEGLTAPNARYTFHVAYCMQPAAQLTDSHIIRWEAVSPAS